MRAYVLLQFKPGKERDVYADLSKIKNITYADVVHGPYDMVLVLEGNIDDIDKTVMSVRQISEVQKTETLLSFNPVAWSDISYELASGHLSSSETADK